MLYLFLKKLYDWSSLKIGTNEVYVQKKGREPKK